MRQLRLREYQTATNVELSLAQRDQLLALPASVTIAPVAGETNRFDLTPGSIVGAIHLDGLDIVIQPKVELDRLLFMLSYSLGHIRNLPSFVSLADAPDLPEAIVQAYVRQVGRALSRGVLQGYRTIDESSLTLRGRLRVGDQIRRRFGPYPPAEITYDDFTVDIELNRLLRAATDRLSRMRLRSDRSRAGLRGIEARLEGVSLVAYDPRRLPAIAFNRLNERYRDAVALARFILQSASFEVGHGVVPATAFLVDMNRAFEDFVVVALRDALGSDAGELVQGAQRRRLFLDEGDSVRLEPDLSLWRGDRCVFVGDVKYKRVYADQFPNADIYQATAYAIATGLDRVLLIYAAGNERPATHRIVHVGKVLEIVTLDLAQPPEGLLGQIRSLAGRIREMASTSSPVAA